MFSLSSSLINAQNYISDNPRMTDMAFWGSTCGYWQVPPSWIICVFLGPTTENFTDQSGDSHIYMHQTLRRIGDVKKIDAPVYVFSERHSWIWIVGRSQRDVWYELIATDPSDRVYIALYSVWAWLYMRFPYLLQVVLGEYPISHSYLPLFRVFLYPSCFPFRLSSLNLSAPRLRQHL